MYSLFGRDRSSLKEGKFCAHGWLAGVRVKPTGAWLYAIASGIQLMSHEFFRGREPVLIGVER